MTRAKLLVTICQIEWSRSLEYAQKAYKQRVRQLTRRIGGMGMAQVALKLKQWKMGRTMYRELTKLGAPQGAAERVAANSRCWWRNSDRLIKTVLTIQYFDKLGVPRLV
jgi:hypothetical protein